MILNFEPAADRIDDCTLHVVSGVLRTDDSWHLTDKGILTVSVTIDNSIPEVNNLQELLKYKVQQEIIFTKE